MGRVEIADGLVTVHMPRLGAVSFPLADVTDVRKEVSGIPVVMSFGSALGTIDHRAVSVELKREARWSPQLFGHLRPAVHILVLGIDDDIDGFIAAVSPPREPS